MRSNVRMISLLLSCFIILTSTGCWDMKEINDQSYVIGLGIDTASDGFYDFTFQKAVPVGIDSSADSNSIEFRNVTVQAASLAEAVRTMAVSSSNEMNFEHLSCILIGSELARANFTPLLEYLMQQPDVRRQCVVAIASGTAQALLKTEVSNAASSLSIAAMLNEADTSRGSSVVRTLSTVDVSLISGEGCCLYVVGSGTAHGISASDTDNSIAVTGAYVFSSNGLSGILSARDTDLLRLFAASQSDGLVRAESKTGEEYFFWIEHSFCDISCEIISGRLFYNITVNAVCRTADSSGASLEEIDAALIEDALFLQLSDLLERSQNELGAAAVGLDDAARKTNHSWYAANRSSFDELYRSAVITLDVSCQLERSGVLR